MDGIKSTATIMDSILKILPVEDSETYALLLIRYLKKENIDFNQSGVWVREKIIYMYTCCEIIQLAASPQYRSQ